MACALPVTREKEVEGLLTLCPSRPVLISSVPTLGFEDTTSPGSPSPQHQVLLEAITPGTWTEPPSCCGGLSKRLPAFKPYSPLSTVATRRPRLPGHSSLKVEYRQGMDQSPRAGHRVLTGPQCATPQHEKPILVLTEHRERGSMLATGKACMGSAPKKVRAAAEARASRRTPWKKQVELEHQGDLSGRGQEGAVTNVEVSESQVLGRKEKKPRPAFLSLPSLVCSSSFHAPEHRPHRSVLVCLSLRNHWSLLQCLAYS